MFARVSDKFHNRKQASPSKASQSSVSSTVPPGSAVSPTNSTALPPPQPLGQGDIPAQGVPSPVAQPSAPTHAASSPSGTGLVGYDRYVYVVEASDIEAIHRPVRLLQQIPIKRLQQCRPGALRLIMGVKPLR